MTDLIGSLLQCEWPDPRIDLPVLLQDGVEAPARGPLQDEAKGLEDHTHKLDDVRMVHSVENGDLSPDLHVGLGGHFSRVLLGVHAVDLDSYLATFVILRDGTRGGAGRGFSTDGISRPSTVNYVLQAHGRSPLDGGGNS